MPSHKIHRYLSLLAQGDDKNKVHSKLDEAYGYVGKTHRKYGHDPLSIALISHALAKQSTRRNKLGFQKEFESNLAAGLLHKQADEFFSRGGRQAENFKWMLFFLAMLNQSP